MIASKQVIDSNRIIYRINSNIQNNILIFCMICTIILCMNLDEVDLRILAILQRDGRITNFELAKRIGLTPAPTLARVKKLELAGYIRHYAALLDQAKLGMTVTTFVQVNLESHKKKTTMDFMKAVEKMPEVLECHHIAGDEDFLLKVVASDPLEYEKFVLEKLTKVEGIEKVKTIFVLSSSKLETAIPVKGGLSS
jgi:Lrp/AsnC family transcriptional regulator, leucine-responsive regulatory protein